MRAVCEACAQPQPVGWKAGDLCTFCGKSVRHDLRCFWCAKWTPPGKFCRSCGAETVNEALYGAARMLKDAGTDRFSVPKMLRELDPDQIDNFTRIYQRHAILVARHVDDLRFLERFLHQQHWSAQREDELIPQLPWSDEALARHTVTPLPTGDDLAIAQGIQATSPFPQTRQLAAVVRLRRDDWDAYRDVQSAVTSPDPTIRTEAALALSSWRVQTQFDFPGISRETANELEHAPVALVALVRRAMLSNKPIALPPEAITSSDPEIAFTAALAIGDVKRLRVGLTGDQLTRIAAGCALARLGVTEPLAPLIADGPDDVRDPLLRMLARNKQPAPELTSVLIRLIETTTDEHLRARAAQIICKACPPGIALRIARAAQGDRSILQSLIQFANLPSDELVDVGRFMVENNLFSRHQYGMTQIAEVGRMPTSFVLDMFGRADDERRCELCLFAESQLGQRDDETLHRFLLNVLYGDYSAKVRAAAWWSVHRWYRQSDHRGDGPLKLEVAAITRFFGSMANFLPRLTNVLRDYDTLKEVGVFDHLGNLLSYPDDAVGPAIVAEEPLAHDFVRALLNVLKNRDYYANLRTGAAKTLCLIGKHPRWQDEILADLTAFLANEDGDLVYYVKKVIATITGKSDD
ncbi:MAG: hypothetical protein AAB263_11945 [Planctomycetota bacterium]